jgi:hypothetical protein
MIQRIKFWVGYSYLRFATRLVPSAHLSLRNENSVKYKMFSQEIKCVTYLKFRVMFQWRRQDTAEADVFRSDDDDDDDDDTRTLGGNITIINKKKAQKLC